MPAVIAADKGRAIAATLLAGVAAVLFGIVAAQLLHDLDGTACGAEIPFCTTPTQQFARVVLAALCAGGIAAAGAAVWAIWRGSPRSGRAYLFILFAVAAAVALLLVDPSQHMASDQGAGQWFGW